MPEVGITRELSVTEVNQIQHKRNVSITSILALVFLGSFFYSLRDLSPTYAIGTVVLLGCFLISFINIRVGFVLITLAFLFSPEIDLSFIGLRHFPLRVEDLLIIVVALAWLGRLAMGLQKYFIFHSPLNLPILLIIVWNIICSWRAISEGWVNPQYCMLINLKVIEFFVIYFVIANNLNNMKEVRFIFSLLLITALAVGLYASFQIPKIGIFFAYRLSAPFEGSPEPNTLGAYLAVFFGMALAIFIYAKRSALKKLCAVLLVILPFPIMFSFARSAYIATLVIVFAMAIISKRRWLLVLLFTFIVLSPFILPQDVIDRVMYNFRDARLFGFLDQSAVERLSVWKKAWQHIVRFTILGGGLSREGGILDSYYARVIIETGLIGLTLFMWLIVRIFKVAISVFRNANEGWTRGMAAGFIVILLGLLVHAIGNITFYIVRIAEPFWALVALVSFSFYHMTTLRR